MANAKRKRPAKASTANSISCFLVWLDGLRNKRIEIRKLNANV
jgi:hypothetical protein